MARSRPRPIEDIELAYAAHPRRPGTGAGDAMRARHFLWTQMGERESWASEPVRVPERVNGRPLEGWERGLYRQAMQRERRRELALFDGLIG